MQGVISFEDRTKLAARFKVLHLGWLYKDGGVV